MNSLPTTFLEKAAEDNRLLPSHLSLVMAISYFRNNNIPSRAIKVSRSKLMRFSRIKSIATYHKCIRELIDFGYVIYQPSYHPTNGSSIWLLSEN